jgi:hypothetical protein
VDTRGWIGGASRREILSIKPEILFLRAVCETSLKAFLTRSPASGLKGYTMVEGCQGATPGFPRPTRLRSHYQYRAAGVADNRAGHATHQRPSEPAPTANDDQIYPELFGQAHYFFRHLSYPGVRSGHGSASVLIPMSSFQSFSSTSRSVSEARRLPGRVPSVHQSAMRSGKSGARRPAVELYGAGERRSVECTRTVGRRVAEET